MRFTDIKDLTKQEYEEGKLFAPKFDDKGLITVVTIHAETKEVLMVAYMNEQSLAQTIQIGEAVYWSRSRQEIWHKGATSGQVQKVIDMHTDCDQDALVLSVLPGGNGGCCHVGYESCFYRRIDFEESRKTDTGILTAPEQEKL